MVSFVYANLDNVVNLQDELDEIDYVEIEMMYANADHPSNTLNKQYYDLDICYLQKEIANGFIQAATNINKDYPGYIIKVVDCYRPPDIDQIMINDCKDSSECIIDQDILNFVSLNVKANGIQVEVYDGNNIISNLVDYFNDARLYSSSGIDNLFHIIGIFDYLDYENIGDLYKALNPGSVPGDSSTERCRIPPIDYDPFFIISDVEFEDWEIITKEDIQNFLNTKGGSLKNEINEVLPSEAIYNAAVKYEINPIVLLATLQKEQSLIEQPANENKLNWAAGCGKPDTGEPDYTKMGFDKQIDCMGERFRTYLETWIPRDCNDFPCEKEVLSGEGDISIYNPATYTLFIYTPHTHDTSLGTYGGGNYLFYTYYYRYYKEISKKEGYCAENMDLPDLPKPPDVPDDDDDDQGPTITEQYFLTSGIYQLIPQFAVELATDINIYSTLIDQSKDLIKYCKSWSDFNLDECIRLQKFPEFKADGINWEMGSNCGEDLEQLAYQFSSQYDRCLDSRDYNCFCDIDLSITKPEKIYLDNYRYLGSEGLRISTLKGKEKFIYDHIGQFLCEIDNEGIKSRQWISLEQDGSNNVVIDSGSRTVDEFRLVKIRLENEPDKVYNCLSALSFNELKNKMGEFRVSEFDECIYKEDRKNKFCVKTGDQFFVKQNNHFIDDKNFYDMYDLGYSFALDIKNEDDPDLVDLEIEQEQRSDNVFILSWEDLQINDLNNDIRKYSLFAEDEGNFKPIVFKFKDDFDIGEIVSSEYNIFLLPKENQFWEIDFENPILTFKEKNKYKVKRNSGSNYEEIELEHNDLLFVKKDKKYYFILDPTEKNPVLPSSTSVEKCVVQSIDRYDNLNIATSTNQAQKENFDTLLPAAIKGVSYRWLDPLFPGLSPGNRNVKLSWEEATLNEDGTELEDLKEYQIYYSADEITKDTDLGNLNHKTAPKDYKEITINIPDNMNYITFVPVDETGIIKPGRNFRSAGFLGDNTNILSLLEFDYTSTDSSSPNQIQYTDNMPVGQGDKIIIGQVDGQTNTLEIINQDQNGVTVRIS
ncbi:hypothetical protein ACFL1H_05925 [Nanoarchaeota archaeon]